MKLLDLHISGFGKFHDRSVTFEDGLNIVYGKNETGKSTLHTFIRSMLFGIERQRGRASKTDTYSRFLPWENKGVFEGRLRLEKDGHVYRLERNFQNNKTFTVVDETLGREIEPTKAFMDSLLGGLSETAYNNTVSIGQLKSATDAGMVTELKNYIANMNTTGNLALNITKATAFLKAQRKSLENQIVPEAARNYTALLGEIRNIEKETTSPEYENHLASFRQKRDQVSQLALEKQQEKEDLIQKIARGRQLLTSSQFTDEASISRYEDEAQVVYGRYQTAKIACGKRSNKILMILSFVLSVLLTASAGGAGFLVPKFLGPEFLSITAANLLPVCLAAGAGALLFLGVGIVLAAKRNGVKKELDYSSKLLQEIFSRHLGDSSISQEAMDAFTQRMAEYRRLSAALEKSEEIAAVLTKEIEALQAQQTTCTEAIEQQQRTQWELEQKLERLSNCKTQAEALRHVLAENERLSQEIAAIDLAQEIMTTLSTTIRDSFGLYLNKEASKLITHITGGIYNSMSVDENLHVFMNTKTKLVPLEQVSSGTMDQVYLALRLAAARLIQKGTDPLPLIFDDSFVLYDDERLRTALKWLVEAYPGQIIIFTCHQREAQMLTANMIPYHLIEMG